MTAAGGATGLGEFVAIWERQVRCWLGYGGDEFIVILPRQNKAEALLKVSRMKHVILSTPFLQKEGINAHGCCKRF